MGMGGLLERVHTVVVVWACSLVGLNFNLSHVRVATHWLRV